MQKALGRGIALEEVMDSLSCKFLPGYPHLEIALSSRYLGIMLKGAHQKSFPSLCSFPLL